MNGASAGPGSSPMTGVSAGRPGIDTGGVGMIPMPGTAGFGGFAGFAGESGEPQAGGAAPDLPPGISEYPSAIECSATCESVELLGGTYIDPCCAASDACGLNGGLLQLLGVELLEGCQARHQPGVPDASCRAKGTLAMTVGEQTVLIDPLPGCCRPSGACGVMVDRLSLGGGVVPLGAPGWGCMDAGPFFVGAAPQFCGSEGGAPSQGFGGAPDLGAGGTGPEGGAGN
jgi:hypothetical protein